MITNIKVQGYRALQGIDVTLTPFQLLVGSNAAGKSTFCDVLLFVRDIVRHGLEKSVYYTSDGVVRTYRPLDLTWMQKDDRIHFSITAQVPDDLNVEYQFVCYDIGVEVMPELSIASEDFYLCNGHTRKGLQIIGRTPENHVYLQDEKGSFLQRYSYGKGQTLLSHIPDDGRYFQLSLWFRNFLLGVQNLVLDAQKIRMPSPVGTHSDFKPDGSNLPWVVHELDKIPEQKQRWVDHVAMILPDIQDIKSQELPADRSRYIEVVYKNGLIAPAWVLSDGTLRLLALTLLACMPNPPALLMIEEPENGVHPKALDYVMQSLTSLYQTQLLCASHSSLLLGLLKPKDLLCFTKNDTGAVSVIRGDKHPVLQEWQDNIALSDLFAMGILG